MKRIRFLILGALVLAAPCRTSAQVLDELFDEEDFQSSEVDKMQKENAARKETAQQKNKAEPVASAPVPAPVAAKPAAPQPAPVAAAPAVGTPQPAPATPKTFSLSTSPQAIKAAPALPAIGAGGAQNMPSLGNGQKSEENLSLFERRAKKTGNSGTNVLKFDIAGVKLKMTPQEAIEKATEAGFSIRKSNENIPDLTEWKYHRSCLQQMFFNLKAQKTCIREKAQLENSEYISEIVFENKPRRETLTVEFTSKSSKNQAYRIRYVTKGDHSLGTTEEALYLKAKRRQEFMDLLIKKYGYPDDGNSFSWGVAGYSAVLQVEMSDAFSDFTLVMENPSMEESDYDAVFKENMKADPVNKFSF